MSESKSNLDFPSDTQLVIFYSDKPILEDQEYTKIILKLNELPEGAVEIESKFPHMRSFKCS